MADPVAPWESTTQEPSAPWENNKDNTTQVSAAGNAKKETEIQLSPLDRGAGERMLGVEELVNNLGIGKHIGLPSNDILDQAKNIAEDQGEEARKNEGMMGKIGSFLGEAGGDPLTYVGGAEFKGAKGLTDVGRAGAKYGAISGLTDTGAGNISNNIMNALSGGVQGAVLAPAMVAGGEGVGAAKRAIGRTARTLGEGFSARTPEELKTAADKIRSEADKHYAAMRKENSYITPEAAKTMQTDVGKKLVETGIFNKELHKGTLSVLKQLQKDSENGISVEKLDQYRRLLSGVVNDKPKTEDAKKAMTAIREIDNVVDNLKPEHFTSNNKTAVEALNNARYTWAKARKFEMITDIIDKSNGDPNRRKVLLEQLANNKNKTRGFTSEERKALKDAAQNNTVEGLTKMFGKLGINIGSTRSAATGNVIPAVELLAAGVKKGVPVIAAGTGAKYVQNLIGKAKTERLLKAIESNGAPVNGINSAFSPQSMNKAISSIKP